MDNTFTQIPHEEIIEKTVSALNENGFNAQVVASADEAKQLALSLLPEGAEVMTMTSTTLDALGLTDEINSSGKYDAVKPKLFSMNREENQNEMQKLGAGPEYALGSVHAVTENGQVIIASNSGSQLPGYSYGANNVIWIVGAQKLVKDFDEGMKRIYEHTLPLESERAKKAYGVPGSFVSKLLVMNREPNPQRITTIIVKENLGY